jgi:hypothetical protein
MLTKLHGKNKVQLIIGLLIGIAFGFLLQKGGVTDYNVIIGQLLLTDFTVVKIMLAASITGMLGVHLLRSLGLAQLHPKPGSIGASVIGGLIFGVGFAVLGYCPGTVAGAVGQGALDALYPKLQKSVLSKGDFGELTLPEVLKVNQWIVVIPVAVALTVLLWWMERVGL